MSYVLFLDDERHPTRMHQWHVETSTVVRRTDGTLYVLRFRSGVAPFSEVRMKDHREWVIVRNYDAFVDALADRGIPEVVCLDHDLCEEHYVDGFQGEAKTEGYREKTGYDCAKFLAQKIRDELPNECVVEIVLHSMNPTGRQNMAAAFLELNQEN